MKNNKKSFITICVIQNIIFLIVILILCLLFYCIANYRLEKSFPTIDDLLEYEEQLQKDNYSNIPLIQFNNCAIIIYNENGLTLYSSNKKINEEINVNDIDFVNDYIHNEYFMVYNFMGNDKSKDYYIVKVKKDENDETEQVMDFCILNENLEVIEGTLFGDKKQISEFEFNLINGSYQDYQIERYKYKNVNNEDRILLFIQPKLTNRNYRKAISDVNKIWFFAIPIILIIILIEAWFYKQKLKKCIEPLYNMLSCYEGTKNIVVNNDEILVEFQPVANKFKELLEKIEKNKVEKNKMFANISHDLKTPISAIRGYVQAFKDNIVPEDKKKQYINAIYDKIINLTNLIDRLFEYTKLEHPDYKLNLENIDINKFSKEYLANKYLEIEMKKFKLEAKIPGKECICNIDQELFTRLYDNLLYNTLKHNEKGTKILFQIIENKETVEIIIADNGSGIPEEIRAHLFEPFITGNTARTSGEGNGLGMAIAKHIVDLHHGKIKLNEISNEEYITEFKIELKKYCKKI